MKLSKAIDICLFFFLSLTGAAAVAGASMPYLVTDNWFWAQHQEQLPNGRLLVLGTRALWVTDGTASGTFQVPGSEELDRLRTDRKKLARVGERLYFEAKTPETGYEIWWSDGETVELFADLAPGPEDAPLLALGSAGGKLVYATYGADRVDIWTKSDGGGHALSNRVAELVYHDFIRIPHPESTPIAEIRPLGDSAVVFAGWYKRLVGSEEAVWRIAGTAPGARRITRIARDGFTPATTVGNHVYTVTQGDRLALWRSDGTIDGTGEVVDLPAEVVRVYDLRPLGDHLAMPAFLDPPGRQLWLSDGTAAGTTLLPITRQVSDIAVTSDRLYVTSHYTPWRTPMDFLLWQFDLESRRLERVVELEGYGYLATFGDVLYYTVSGEYEEPGSLWRTDGTVGGTVHLGSPAPIFQTDWRPVRLGNRLLFQTATTTTGRGLWAVDVECMPSSETLCLAGGRFQARARWHDRNGSSFPARAEASGAAAGRFSFFDPDVPELAFKILDGRSINDHFWTFSGALTDLGVDLHLFDTATGAESLHIHPAGNLSSVTDVQTFTEAPGAGPRSVQGTSGPGEIAVSQETATPEACQASDSTLCLMDGRFTITLERRTSNGPTAGFARLISDRSGELSYSRGGVPELVVKALDGRPINGHLWIFVGSLTDLDFRLTVTDSVTGTRRIYSNPRGRSGGFADIETFSDF